MTRSAARDNASWGLLMVAVSLLASCVLAPNKEPAMTYEETKAQLIRLVDDTLAAGLQGDSPSPMPTVSDKPCDDAWGGASDEVYVNYQYHFPLKALGNDPDKLVIAAENLWQMRGFTVTRDDNTPGVPTRFAVVDSGYNLKVFVNHNTQMALVGGSSPCIKPGAKS